MKKGALIIALIALVALNISFANALINETKQINEAYDWLEDQVRNNWQSLNTLQHEATLLAIAYKTDLKNQGFNYLRQKGWPQGNPVCWGKNAVNNENQCKIKESAIASFIYSEFDHDYSKINEWLLNQSSLFTNIQWYLQVDIERGLNASCNVTYEGGQAMFKIDENKKIEIGTTPSPCLSVYQDYWIEIDKSCYDKDFKLTCQINDPTETYKVGFLYRKSKNPQDNEWHASDFSYTIDSSDYVDISIRDISICLADQGQCDYEANAIAAYVLKQQGNAQYAALMPFLVINAQENVKKNSYAWLYLLTGNGKYGDLVLSSENIQGFWNLLSGFGQFYDTAISGYSLIQNYNANYNASETKEYLLSRQNNQGYWLCSEIGCEKIRDTALLLYVFWPKAIAGGGGGGNYTTNVCEDAGGTCDLWCDPEAGFIEKQELSYDCGNYLCCIPTSSLSCYDPLINGELCDVNEVCVNGYNITTTETLQGLGYCCYNGTCQAASQSCDEQNGYICDQVNSFCPQGYEIAATGLSAGEVCCQLACQSCSDIGGKICGNDEICQGESNGECCLGDCIKNAECSDLGGESCGETGWSCNGELVKTLDTDYCCVNGNCVKGCEEEGGQICFEDEKCIGDEIDASDLKAGEICCIGECKKKAGFNWGLVILFLILIALIVGGYFLYKKGKLQALFKRKGKPPAAPSIFKAPTKPTPPVLPRTLPTLPRQPQPTMQKVPSIKPRPLPKAIPKPIPIAKPKEKLEIPKEKAKEKKAKSKTEEQLEKTLKRIKELTK